MPISVEWPGCHFSFRVGDRQAGRRGRCPRCKAEVVAPEPLESTAIQASEAFEAFFIDSLSLVQTLPLPAEYPAPSNNPRKSKQALIDARRDMELTHLDNLHCLLRWNSLHPRRVKAKAALVLLNAGCKLNADEYEIHSATTADAQVALSKADDGLKTMHTAMEPFQDAAARRLIHALELLSIEPLTSRVAGGPGRLPGTRKVYPTAAFLASRTVPEMSHLMDEYQVAGRLIVAIQEGKNSKNNRFLEGCHDALVKLSRRLSNFRTLLQSAPPSILENEQGSISLASYALPFVPGPDQPIELVTAASHAVDELTSLYRHVLGRLAVSVEEVEKVLGLPPLERTKAEE